MGGPRRKLRSAVGYGAFFKEPLRAPKEDSDIIWDRLLGLSDTGRMIGGDKISSENLGLNAKELDVGAQILHRTWEKSPNQNNRFWGLKNEIDPRNHGVYENLLDILKHFELDRQKRGIPDSSSDADQDYNAPTGAYTPQMAREEIEALRENERFISAGSGGYYPKELMPSFARDSKSKKVQKEMMKRVRELSLERAATSVNRGEY